MIRYPYDEGFLQKVASLYCEGMEKQDIADIFSISESDVNGMVEMASQKGYFHYRPALASHALNPEVFDFVHQVQLTSALTRCLRQKMECLLTPLTIVPSPLSMFTRYASAPDKDSATLNDYLKAERVSVQMAAERAAQKISNVLFNGEDHTVGLNWGAAVWETVKRIHPIPSQIKNAKISVVSLFGDLDFFSPNSDLNASGLADFNCNNLVVQLVQRLGGQGESLPLNVPGFIPAVFAKKAETFNAIRSFMMSHSSYRRIFGDLPQTDPREPRHFEGIRNRPTDAKMAQVDTILSGLGTADQYTVLRNYHTSLLDSHEIESLMEYCRRGKIVGDIGGHLIASKEGQHDKKVMQFLVKINSRLLAAQPSDFIDVASRHRKSKKGAGVVAITVGARKANVVYTLLSWEPSPINMLIMDSHCALALLHLVDPKAYQQFIASPAGKLLLVEKEKWSDATQKLIPI